MPSELRSTTPTSSWPALSVTGRPRRDRRPPDGTRTSSSIPAGRRGVAHPPPQRVQDRGPDCIGPDPESELLPCLGGLRLPTGGGRGWFRRRGAHGRARKNGIRIRRHRRRDPRDPSGGRSRWTNARPTWPMVILRTPKGWTGPRRWRDPVEGTFRAHQLPLAEVDQSRTLSLAGDLASQLPPEELFDDGRRPMAASSTFPRPANGE